MLTTQALTDFRSLLFQTLYWCRFIKTKVVCRKRLSLLDLQNVSADTRSKLLHMQNRNVALRIILVNFLQLHTDTRQSDRNCSRLNRDSTNNACCKKLSTIFRSLKKHTAVILCVNSEPRHTPLRVLTVHQAAEIKRPRWDRTAISNMAEITHHVPFSPFFLK